MERLIREMEEADAQREIEEVELAAKRAAEKAHVEALTQAERKKQAAEEDRKLREQEREMERTEDERLEEERERLRAAATSQMGDLSGNG